MAASLHGWGYVLRYVCLIAPPPATVNVYHNELFKNEEEANAAAAAASTSARPGTASKMAAQKSSLAARRQERMQGNIYTSNDAQMGRPPVSVTSIEWEAPD